MSYFDWQHLVKRLQFQPVIQDTIANTKALSITPVRDVGVVVHTFDIPSITITPYSISDAVSEIIQIVPLIVNQINYTASSALVLTDFKQYASNFEFSCVAVCVRFRVGGVVTRYRLLEPSAIKSFQFVQQIDVLWPGALPVFAPLYEGQVIQPNFVIEFWQVVSMPTEYFAAQLVSTTTPEMSFSTGIIHIPTDENDVGTTTTPAAIVNLVDLQSALPETVPTAVDANGPWLTN